MRHKPSVACAKRAGFLRGHPRAAQAGRPVHVHTYVRGEIVLCALMTAAVCGSLAPRLDSVLVGCSSSLSSCRWVHCADVHVSRDEICMSHHHIPVPRCSAPSDTTQVPVTHIARVPRYVPSEIATTLNRLHTTAYPRNSRRAARAGHRRTRGAQGSYIVISLYLIHQWPACMQPHGGPPVVFKCKPNLWLCEI